MKKQKRKAEKCIAEKERSQAGKKMRKKIGKESKEHKMMAVKSEEKEKES